jgi:hypothetical protein
MADERVKVRHSSGSILENVRSDQVGHLLENGWELVEPTPQAVDKDEADYVGKPATQPEVARVEDAVGDVDVAAEEAPRRTPRGRK